KLPGTIAPTADFDLARKAVETAEKLGIPVKAGNILSSDIFYNDWEKANEEWKKMGILAVEMESCALYLNAARAGKKALCLCTISDKVFTGESLSSTERQLSFTDMMKVALEIA
ncbi:MAG: purine-nucleoside phosphorylase, partial [Erysipelotrichaceae bacterium]|nr:purine-nucleoside phosphorylase [Erysipelotrichaceae bacterium]